MKMASRKMLHYTTLSSTSKKTLQSGNLTKMLIQLKKPQCLYQQGTAATKGQLHRHVVAVKYGIKQHMTQLGQIHGSAEDMTCNSSSLHADDSSVHNDRNTDVSSKHPNLHKERDTLSKRWMRNRKTQQLVSRKKAKADDSLKQEIYKHYYQKLTKVTKMTVSPVNPFYMSRVMARSAGYPPECYTQSYEEKFRSLLHKLKTKWKPRDYVQRLRNFRSLFSRLCTNIIDCIKECTSAEGDTLECMDRLDNLFRVLRRFKIPSPTFRPERVLKGGGPKKHLKGDVSEYKYWVKRDVIGKDQLSVQ